MLPLRLTTKKYIKEQNIFKAILPSDEIVYFDPFVSCAIEMSDEEYSNGLGYEFENMIFLLTDFSVQQWMGSEYMIIPEVDGMINVLGVNIIK